VARTEHVKAFIYNGILNYYGISAAVLREVFENL
jgi:hypothetical protein